MVVVTLVEVVADVVVVVVAVVAVVAVVLVVVVVVVVSIEDFVCQCDDRKLDRKSVLTCDCAIPVLSHENRNEDCHGEDNHTRNSTHTGEDLDSPAP